MRALSFGGSVRATFSGIALLGALGCALVPGRPVALAIGLGALGASAALVHTAPATTTLLWRRRGLFIIVVFAGLLVAWIIVGVVTARRAWPGLLHLPEGAPAPPYVTASARSTAWPWRVGRLPLLPLLLAVVSAGGGFALVCDAVRVQLGLGRPPRSLWRSLTTTPPRGGQVTVRAVSGVALIGVDTFLGISLISRYVADDHILATLGMLGIGALAALLVASPVAVGLATRLDVDKAGRAREEERRRLAAHLHDSVLQTLALVQRQATDPESVIKLARRQEHALRAWMAGEADLGNATIATAVRDMVTEVEEDFGMTVELTAIGDAELEARGEQLIAAAREALRNTARHAPGAPVTVFLDIDPTRTEMFIRDDGPGFDFLTVPVERRGLRDAVIGRMSYAGGSATVDSVPGEGTEIALTLPTAGALR